jgi:hypothetical protein
MTVVVRTRRATASRASSTLGIALLTFWLLTFWFGSHAPADAAPLSETDPSTAEVEDGLQQVPVRGPGTFWVRPGVDLRGYDRVALKPLALEYKKTPRHHRIDSSSKGVLLTDRDHEQLQEWFYDAFKTGLARGAGFGPASKADPGLLWVSTSLVDVIVRYPDEPGGNEQSLVQNFGEMTLRVDFSDADTGETIARFEERRIIGPSGEFKDHLFRRNDYIYWMAIRANLSRWSELVRRRMYDQRSGTAQF